jgi:hypothetical protein
MVLTFLSLAFGTLVSEDLACVTAGLLIQRGQIDPSTGIIACIIGIFGGDVGLWGAGRVFGHAALAWPWIARKRQSFGDLRSVARTSRGRRDRWQPVSSRHAAAALRHGGLREAPSRNLRGLGVHRRLAMDAGARALDRETW